MAGVAWLRQNAGLLRGKVVKPAFPNMDAKEQQELLERIRSSTDEEEKHPLLFTFDFQEDMEVFLNMAAEEDLRVNAMFYFPIFIFYFPISGVLVDVSVRGCLQRKFVWVDVCSQTLLWSPWYLTLTEGSMLCTVFQING